ncbi:MAG: IS256 family transposase [bacterium]|nr:IS256 family transposase [bacterium]
MSDEIIQVNREAIKGELSKLVRQSVEDVINAFLDHEADVLVNASRYERSDDRNGYRSGHYDRDFLTKSGNVRLHIPKLKGLKFETAILERYRRRESSIEEALIEMYVAGASVRRIEDITEALWGTHVSPTTVSNLNHKAYQKIEEWRCRPITGQYAYVYIDGIFLKRSWGGEVRNVSVLVAIGVNNDGFREILGAAEGMKEDRESWLNFFKWLKKRGLDGVQLFIGDKNLGMLDSIGEVFPDAKYQRCIVHFYRNVFSVVPRTKVRTVAMMLKAIHSQESKKEAKRKAATVAAKLRDMKLNAAARKVETDIDETLMYMDFPSQHWTRLRTNNTMERLNRELKRRTRAIGAFPDGNSALMLVCARLRYIAGTIWGVKRYMNIDHLSSKEVTGSSNEII